MSTHLGCQEHIYKWPPTTKTKPSIASAPCVAAALPIQFGQKLPRPPRAYTHLAVQRTSSALRAAVQHPSSSAAEGHASIAMHLQTVAWYQFIQCRVKAPACVVQPAPGTDRGDACMGVGRPTYAWAYGHRTACTKEWMAKPGTATVGTCCTVTMHGTQRREHHDPWIRTTSPNSNIGSCPKCAHVRRRQGLNWTVIPMETTPDSCAWSPGRLRWQQLVPQNPTPSSLHPASLRWRGHACWYPLVGLVSPPADYQAGRGACCGHAQTPMCPSTEPAVQSEQLCSYVRPSKCVHACAPGATLRPHCRRRSPERSRGGPPAGRPAAASPR